MRPCPLASSSGSPPAMAWVRVGSAGREMGRYGKVRGEGTGWEMKRGDTVVRRRSPDSGRRLYSLRGDLRADLENLGAVCTLSEVMRGIPPILSNISL